MSRSEKHLEDMLADYNDKVFTLEQSGTQDELLEAYINRGTILMMMESYVSALDDFDEAADMIDVMLAADVPVDIGSYVKVYESRGQLLCGEENDGMLQDYSRIMLKLDVLGAGCRHYDLKGIVMMCLGCSEDLLDEGFPESAVPFLEKSLSIVRGKTDDWGRNRAMETYNLLAQSRYDCGLRNEGVSAYTEAAVVGESLMRSERIEDVMELVCTYVARGDIYHEMGDDEHFVSDHVTAAEMMEDLHAVNALDDVELLVSIHQGIASALLTMHREKEAEFHLMRAMRLGMPEIGNAIDQLS